MSGWDYVREETKNVGAGDHRFEVVSAEEKMSRTNKRMIVVALRPNGASFTVNDYFVEGEYFNRKVTQFFDSTDIKAGDFELLGWAGAIGAARFKEEDGYLKVHYYLDGERAAKLPPWKGEMPERQTVSEIGEATEISDEELPF